MKFRSHKGFTLVELLVVIAIIGVLAAVLVPTAFKAIDKSKVTAAVSDYNAVKSAALSYYSDVGMWPVDGADREGFVVAPTVEPDGWDGPYIERWPSDNSWGGTFTYNVDEGTIFGDDDVEERFITLTNVPEKAVERLTEQLGEDIVVQDSVTDTTVMILISRG